MDTQTCLADTKFTLSFILDKINEQLAGTGEELDHAKLKAVNFEDLTNGSAFFSTVYKLQFTWTDPSISLKSVAVKVPKIKKMGKNDEIRAAAALDYLEYCHGNEVLLYDFLHSASQRHNIPIRVPRFFYGHDFARNHDDGLLIMQDMSGRGKTLKLLPGLNNEQIESCVDELVRLHVLGWKEPGFVLNKKERTNWLAFLEVIGHIAKQIRDINPEFVPLMDVIDKMINMKGLANGFYKGDKFGMPATLVHADLWASNLIFKQNPDGSVSNELLSLIDWQGCHSGNPMTDLSRLLVLNTTAEYRRANTSRLIQKYFDSVRELMDGQQPFTLEQLHEAYDHGLCYTSIYAAFGTPTLVQLDAIVGTGPERESNQDELISRIKAFFEDTVAAVKGRNIDLGV